MKRTNLSILFLFLLPLLILTNCTEKETETDTATSRIQFKMVDGPGDYEEVNIEVLDVMINWLDDDVGWESIGNVQPGIYDLLELTGGEYVLLADEEVPSGYLAQVRLILGENNTVKVDGEIFDLSTPSAQQSGLKIKVNTELLAGVEYKFTFDWDVQESIIKAGNSGNYNLKPTIRATTEAQTGAISGAVNPFDVTCLVTATNGTEIISTLTNDMGLFVLQGVPEGTYSIEIEPDASSVFGVITIDNIAVSLGGVTDVGTIDLQ
jgi:hypothetical protein